MTAPRALHRVPVAPSLLAASLCLGLVDARALAAQAGSALSPLALRGDWDWYRTMGATPTGAWEGRRRFGFVHLELLTPGAVEKYDLDLWSTGRVVPAGHRLRVTVESAALPRYDRNLNTGGDNERDARYLPAHQRVFHDAAHPSHVTLPIVPRPALGRP